MNSYETRSPRTVISIAAVAMTALTLGLSILPAGKSPDARFHSVADSVASEVSRGDIPVVDVAVRDGAPIVVYGFREYANGLRKVSAPHVTPPRRHQS